MRKIYGSLSALLAMALIGCKTTKDTVHLRVMPNYENAPTAHILFFNFAISGEIYHENVKLINAIAGSGRMKNLSVNVHQQNRIGMTCYDKSGKTIRYEEFEHPLLKTVEISDASGKLSKKTISAQKGILSVRLQEDPKIEKITLSVIGSGRKPEKIYALNIRP